MTTVAAASTGFASASLQGFAAAFPGYVRQVHGGVVRVRTDAPRVRLVIGGGSGHYPAFAGWVGPGLADGAVCGDVFASPSAARVRSVASAVDSGRGVILGFGNYTGDQLHFGQAAEDLRAGGVEARVLAVTDDIASAPKTEYLRRRGIAGDLVVFKIVAAAAERGWSIDEVMDVAEHVNRRTRTLGVAFSGCTLPGAGTAQFEVEPETMAIGLGIHGEPGIEVVPRPPHDGLATLLVESVLADLADDLPVAHRRVAVLLNGFGATNNDELFAVHRYVLEQLRENGVVPVGACVGQQVSSLDMSGVSLTLTVLDDRLEPLWLAPASTPSFHQSGDLVVEDPAAWEFEEQLTAPVVGRPGSAASQVSAALVVDGLRQVRDSLCAAERHLGDLDAVAGDGDHGKGMVTGASTAYDAAVEALAAGAGAATTLIHAARIWSDRAGGTSGALWATGIVAAARVLGDEDEPGPATVAAAFRAAADALGRVGGAETGDKTMLDAVVPFVRELTTAVGSGATLRDAWLRAADHATSAAAATADLLPRLGRARTHGERSLGTPDPGAVSFALVVTAAGGVA